MAITRWKIFSKLFSHLVCTLLWGPDAAAEDGTAVDTTAEDARAEDGTAELLKKGGRCGGIT